MNNIDAEEIIGNGMISAAQNLPKRAPSSTIGWILVSKDTVKNEIVQ